VLAPSRAARAEPTAADRETARALMQDGRDLRDQGDKSSALARFRAADDIMHVPTTSFEVARTEVALGLLVEARDAIASIRKLPPRPDDPAPFNEARRRADELDATLDGRIPTLTIHVHAAEGSPRVVSVDGIVLSPASVGLPRSIDPGHHLIVAMAATAEARQEVDIAEGSRAEIDIALATPGSAAVASSFARPASVTSAAAPHPTEGRSHAPNVLTYAALGVTGAGLAVGISTGVLSWSAQSSLRHECPASVCPPGKPSRDLDSANQLATVSSVSLIVAAAGAAVAVTSIVIGAPETPARAGVRVSPLIGAGFAGIRGAF
jgi:hypothetical protein